MISSSGIGGQGRSIWSATPLSRSEQISLTHLLKERSRMTTSARFIDEYRLVGTVYRNYETFLMLWDASNDTSNGSTRPLGLVLDTKPWDVGFPVLSVPEYNMNHELPFRENRSMGVVLFKICGPSYKPFTEIYAIPVGTLAKFPPVGRLGWWEWRRFATLTEISPPSPSSISHILHSRALNFHVPRNSSEVILKVHDFSLRSRRQKAREDPSAPFPSYTVQEFPLDPKYNADSLEFMDSGIFAALVRIYVIPRHVEALTLCTPSLILGVEPGNDTSWRFSATILPCCFRPQSQAIIFVDSPTTAGLVPAVK